MMIFSFSDHFQAFTRLNLFEKGSKFNSQNQNFELLFFVFGLKNGRTN